jgi:hypothetical protein
MNDGSFDVLSRFPRGHIRTFAEPATVPFFASKSAAITVNLRLSIGADFRRASTGLALFLGTDRGPHSFVGTTALNPIRHFLTTPAQRATESDWLWAQLAGSPQAVPRGTADAAERRGPGVRNQKRSGITFGHLEILSAKQ